MPMMGAAASFTEFRTWTEKGPAKKKKSNKFEASRLGGMGGRHHSVDFDQSRPHSGAGLQMFYANQRHQPRPNEAEQMAQAKRRMAAHRERELRNYHQEQQFHRSEFFLIQSLSHSTYMCGVHRHVKSRETRKSNESKCHWRGRSS